MPECLRLSAATVVGMIWAVGTATASGGEQSHPCASIADDGARLACYDDAFGEPARNSAGTVASAGGASPEAAAAGAATATAATSGAAPVTAAQAAKAREDFGLTEADKRALDPERAEISQPTSITGTVVNIARRPTSELVVTLDNAQVWVQAESDTKVILKAGDVVTIRKAALGSHLLVTQNHATMRVRRIK